MRNQGKSFFKNVIKLIKNNNEQIQEFKAFKEYVTQEMVMLKQNQI